MTSSSPVLPSLLSSFVASFISYFILDVTAAVLHKFLWSADNKIQRSTLLTVMLYYLWQIVIGVLIWEVEFIGSTLPPYLYAIFLGHYIWELKVYVCYSDYFNKNLVVAKKIHHLITLGIVATWSVMIKRGQLNWLSLHYGYLYFWHGIGGGAVSTGHLVCWIQTTKYWRYSKKQEDEEMGNNNSDQLQQEIHRASILIFAFYTKLFFQGMLYIIGQLFVPLTHTTHNTEYWSLVGPAIIMNIVDVRLELIPSLTKRKKLINQLAELENTST